jgi:hypothetical protein
MRTNTQITLLTRGITPRIDRPQYEDGTELGLMVMDTDISGYSAQIYEKKSDGTAVYNSCEIEDNTIVVTLDNQMTASEGENKFTIRLTKPGHETFAFPLILNIIGVPFSGEESHSESSILQQFIDEAEGYADDAHDSAVDANASKNAAKAYYDNLASFGTKNHSIMDSNGSPMPARDVLQFANSRVKDDASNNKTIVAPAHGHTNLLNPTMQTKTSSGVTCTANGDGTYTLNGTATSDILFQLQTAIDTLELPKTYRLVGCPSGGSGSTFELNTIKIVGSNRTVIANDRGSGATIEYPSGATYEVRIRIANGATFDNVVFKPMLSTDLSVGYDDFVAYSGDGELNENVAALYEGLESTDANLADVQNQIVTSGNIENGNTATSAHTVGTYIQWKGKFYVVTSAIAVGDTLAVGTNLAAKTVGDVLTQINADLSVNTEKTISLTTSQYESINPANSFIPNKTGIYLVRLYYHYDEPLELRVGTTTDYKNSEYIVNQPEGNLGTLNLICFLNAGVPYSIGTKYAHGGVVDNNAGYIQRLITVS